MKFEIQHMTVEYLEKPLAVDTKIPRFGWWISAKENGLLQQAYRIQVRDQGELVWDSKKVISDSQFHVEYKGKILKPLTKYEWELTVFDAEGDFYTQTSFFETGFLDNREASFSKGKWIGSPEVLSLYANYLSVFRIEMEFTIPEGTTEAGLYYGVDDPRLEKKDRNLLEMENAPGESYIKLVLDIAPVKAGKKARLLAYRKGYAPTDNSQAPLYVTEISEGLLGKNNCHMAHTLILESVYGQTDIFLDKVDYEHSFIGPLFNDPKKNRERRWNMNPIGRGGDYMSFPVLGKIGIYANPDYPFICHRIEVRNFRKPNGILYQGVPEKINTFVDISHGGNTMLRTEFTIEKSLKRARIYATARGVYNLYCNGKKVGEEYLAPGLSQYDKHQYYQTYDVTEQLKQGKNALGAVLGEGWFSGAISYVGENWNYFGEQNSLLLELHLDYTDGAKEIIGSDPSRFYSYNQGPLIYASIFQGTVYDCRKDDILRDFSLPEFNQFGWKSAVEIPCDKTTSCLGEDVVTFFGTIQPKLDFSHMKLLAQPDPGVKETERLTAIAVSEPRPGVYIYDMGQNMAGIPRIVVEGKNGQEIILRFAEVLYPDLPKYEGKIGTMMLENIRAAIVTDRFFLKEGIQVLEPMFTYHGYRYVEITGIEKPLELSCVQGIAFSSMPKLAAEFTCSDPMINRLFQNIGWSLRDNYISIPSDCPQRNERMGWSGDISVFGKTAVYMSESEPFLMRHMAAMRDTQIGGRFSDIAPIGGGFGGVLWGSAGITVPWEMYQHYGDKRVLEEMYPAMISYIKFLTGTKGENGIVGDGPLGDWLGPEISKNENGFLWQAYYVYDLQILCQAAKLLDKTEDYEWLEKEYAVSLEIFRNTYLDEESGLTVYSNYEAAMSLNNPFAGGDKKKEPAKTPTGKYIMDTQTSYAVLLGLNLIEGVAKEKAEEYLNRACSRSHSNDWGQNCPPYTLMTGFIGTAWISQALSNGGYNEAAWRLLRSKDYPSWLYPVINGATTIWERLNSYTKENGFGGNNSMNSFNHYSFGAVGSWILGYAGGVRRGAVPGSFQICPVPDPDRQVTYTDCKVQTVQGEYQVSWNQEEEETVYRFRIPGGKKTKVELPFRKLHQINKTVLETTAGIEDIIYLDNRVCFTAVPGKYCIRLS